MHCTKKIFDDLIWVGANDRRLAMFEGVYSVPNGVSYNSYLLLDEKTILFDTVDKAVSKTFFENITYALDGRDLDYIVVQHMEPDHSATMTELFFRYPNVKVICNQKTASMIKQFYSVDISQKTTIVSEGDTFNTGKYLLNFVMAPMVHWPEVMVTYESVRGILFSADAFGTFGALNGALFADEVDFFRDYISEARRYYCNIVGKYGSQVQSLLRKASGMDLNVVCPLHGFVWRNGFNDYLDKYIKWSAYVPEETGVLIAYASVYGNTENTAEIISSKLREKGVKTVMFDVSVTPASEIVGEAFRWSHLIFASTTYNAGIFITMEALLHDLAAHNIQNRTVALVENGSWAPTSGNLMKQIIESCRNMKVLENKVSLLSSLKDSQLDEVDMLVDAICQTIPDFAKTSSNMTAQENSAAGIDTDVFHKFSYGLFVLTAKDGDKQNGCIINTALQLTSAPHRVTIAVNKANFTHDLIMKTGVFNVSILTEKATFDVFKRFGFSSGRDTDKFKDYSNFSTGENGLPYITQGTNGFVSAKVIESHDYGTHTLFVGEVTEAKVISSEPSVTYAYYFEHIKPKSNPSISSQKSGYVCKICGYVYEGDELPEDFVCPLCKHGPEDFEKIEAPKEEPKKGYECKICGYFYEGDELPEDFVCPLCKHGPDDFVKVE